MILPVALAVIAATVAISASAGTMAKAGVRGLCACCGVVPYRLTFENTVHYPFGYASECVIEDVKLRHEFVLDRNAAFRRITVVENPQKKSVRCRIVQMQSGMGQGAKWMIGTALCFQHHTGKQNENAMRNNSCGDGRKETVLKEE